MATLQESVQEAMEATQGQPPEVQAAAIRAAIPPPPPAAVSWLWKALVLGLVAICIIALAGIIFAVVDANSETSPDVIVTVFTATLTGLIGLFVKAPA